VSYAFTWKNGTEAIKHGYDPANITEYGDAYGIPGYSWPQGEHAVATFNFTVLEAPNATDSVLTCPLALSSIVLGNAIGGAILYTETDGVYQNSFPVAPISKPYFSMTTQGPGASGVNYTATSVGEVFNVTVMLNSSDAALDAVNFGFKLGYNATMLNVLNVYEGPWLPPFGASPNRGTTFTTVFGFNATLNQNYTQVEDSVNPDANGTWHAPFPSGVGVLAIIVFNCTLQNTGSELTCPLTLFDTIVTNTTAGVIPQSQAAVSGTYIIKPKGIRGDFTGQGFVGINDAIILAKAFGSYGPNYLYPGSPASPNWNPLYDLGGYGIINIFDMIILAGLFDKPS